MDESQRRRRRRRRGGPKEDGASERRDVTNEIIFHVFFSYPGGSDTVARDGTETTGTFLSLRFV